MVYWHFAAMDGAGRPVMRDGTLIEIGKRYSVPEAVMCETGFHGSVRAIDALRYAPGEWVSKREILVEQRGRDKVVGTECVHIVGADATEVLRKFARMCALDVAHLWDAPEVVIRYLKTGEESIRADAWKNIHPPEAELRAHDAEWAAAWATTEAGAWNTARSAALAAAVDTEWAKQNRRLVRMLNKLLKEVE